MIRFTSKGAATKMMIKAWIMLIISIDTPASTCIWTTCLERAEQHAGQQNADRV